MRGKDERTAWLVSNVYAYFLRPHLLALSVVFVLIALAGTWLLRGRLVGRTRRVLFFLFMLSSGVVVLVTVLRESSFSFCPGCVGEWAGVDKILSGAVGTDVLLNVVLFVPAAFLATLLWRAPWRIAGIAAVGSLVIEVIQPIIGVGANDVMDLLVNTVGALIGAGVGALVLWVRDSIVDRRFDPGRTVKLVVSLLVGVAVLVGGPAWAATARQAAAADLLGQLFAGTTLADYRANRDTTWAPKLDQFWQETGQPTAVSRSGDTVAVERFTWNIYFAVRCVVAEWTPTGFSTIQLSGTACTDPLELHR